MHEQNNSKIVLHVATDVIVVAEYDVKEEDRADFWLCVVDYALYSNDPFKRNTNLPGL